MKKFLMIAVAAMAVASQAATVQWQLNYSKDSSYAVGQTALLFIGAASETFSYGGTDGLSLSDYVTALLEAGADTATGAAKDSATTVSNARLGIGTASRNVDVTYAAGSDIVAMIVVLDTTNDKYNAFSFETQIAGAGNTQLTSSAADSSTGFQDMPGSGDDPGPGPGPGPGPEPIPEPATGALALAGIALLFRRRRA